MGYKEMILTDRYDNLSGELLAILSKHPDKDVSAPAREELENREKDRYRAPEEPVFVVFSPLSDVARIALQVKAKNQEQALEIVRTEIKEHVVAGSIELAPYDPRVISMDVVVNCDRLRVRPEGEGFQESDY